MNEPVAPRRHGAPGARLLLGDWSRLVRDPIDLLRLALLSGAVLTLALGESEQALRLFLTFLAVVVARVIDLPRPFDLAFVVGMSFQAWGNVLGAFDHVYGYDKVVHFVLPAAMSTLLYVISIRLRVLPDLAHDAGIHERAGIMVVAFAFGMTTGALYEMYEWFSNHLLGARLQVSYGDTIGDLLDDGLGSIAGGVLLIVWNVRGWGTTRRVPAEALERETMKRALPLGLESRDPTGPAQITPARPGGDGRVSSP